MKAFKAFIKPFEAPQRNVKIKIYVNFLSSPGIGTGRVNIRLIWFKNENVYWIPIDYYHRSQSIKCQKITLFLISMTKFQSNLTIKSFHGFINQRFPQNTIYVRCSHGLIKHIIWKSIRIKSETGKISLFFETSIV